MIYHDGISDLICESLFAMPGWDDVFAKLEDPSLLSLWSSYMSAWLGNPSDRQSLQEDPAYAPAVSLRNQYRPYLLSIKELLDSHGEDHGYLRASFLKGLADANTTSADDPLPILVREYLDLYQHTEMVWSAHSPSTNSSVGLSFREFYREKRERMKSMPWDFTVQTPYGIFQRQVNDSSLQVSLSGKPVVEAVGYLMASSSPHDLSIPFLYDLAHGNAFYASCEGSSIDRSVPLFNFLLGRSEKNGRMVCAIELITGEHHG